MNQYEAIRELLEIAKTLGGDIELQHGRADDILVTFLRDNGYAKVASAYDQCREQIGFWYA